MLLTSARPRGCGSSSTFRKATRARTPRRLARHHSASRMPAHAAQERPRSCRRSMPTSTSSRARRRPKPWFWTTSGIDLSWLSLGEIPQRCQVLLRALFNVTTTELRRGVRSTRHAHRQYRPDPRAVSRPSQEAAASPRGRDTRLPGKEARDAEKSQPPTRCSPRSVT